MSPVKPVKSASSQPELVEPSGAPTGNGTVTSASWTTPVTLPLPE